MKEYIKLGSDYRMKNHLGQNIAHIAGKYGYFQMLAFIKFELEMDVEEPDINQMTPLHLAVREGKEAVVGVLVAWSKTFDSLDSDGNSLLHMAAVSKNFKIAKMLLLRGISWEIKNNQGKIAYDLAQEGLDENLMRLLVIST